MSDKRFKEKGPYAVNLWGSCPGENDDCWTGSDYATKGEARAAFEKLLSGELPDGWAASLIHTLKGSTRFVEIDGPDIHEERRTPWAGRISRLDRRFDSEWRQEIAMEAGMLHGIDVYNDMVAGGCGLAEDED